MILLPVRLRGRRGSYGSGGALGSPFDTAALCVAGFVGLADIDLRFAWQAWCLAASTLLLRGECGAYGWRPALGWLWWRAWSALVTFDAVGFCVACVTLSRTIFHTQLSHTTRSHSTLSRTSLPHATLSRTTLSDTHAHSFVTHNSFEQLFHIQLFKAIGPPPFPLFFLPSPHHFDHCF